jgi:superfamily II DNA or RNA helicase
MADVIIEKKNEVYLRLICEPHILYELAPYFTFEVPGAKFAPAYKRGGWNGQISLLSKSTGEIYCGLLDKIIAKIKNHGYTYEFKNSKFYGCPFEVNEGISHEGITAFVNAVGHKAELTPYEYQINAIYECLRYNRKTIVSATSSGKSLMIYCIAKYYLMNDLKVLCVFPTTSLIHQMYKDWESYGYNSEDNIHMIYSGREHKTKLPVTFSTWQGIYENEKAFFDNYDVIIVDECHSVKSKSLINIMKNCHDIKYRFGFTGTLSNNDDGKAVNELTITGLFGPSYKTINTKELIEKGRAAKLDIKCLVLKHDEQKFQTFEDEVQYLITNEKRNNYIKNLALSLKGNTLLIFSRVETHGEILYNLIQGDCDKNRKIFFVHGGVEAKEREEVREIVERENNAIIVASYGVFSTGISIKNLNNIIFGFPSKGKIRVLQTIGRGLRKSKTKDRAVLYDIADNCGNNYTLNHFVERVKLYNEEEFEYEIYNVDL